jgi:hypothetical protein
MKLYELINNNKRKYLNPMKPLVKGLVMNTHNSLEHELKKAEIYYKLKKSGLEVYSEVSLKGTGRIADLIVLDLEVPMIYEIAKSETDESLDAKEQDLKDFKVIRVRI